MIPPAFSASILSQSNPDANPKGEHGHHTYSLEDYGPTQEGIRERYRDYCERFAIPAKS